MVPCLQEVEAATTAERKRQEELRLIWIVIVTGVLAVPFAVILLYLGLRLRYTREDITFLHEQINIWRVKAERRRTVSRLEARSQRMSNRTSATTETRWSRMSQQFVRRPSATLSTTAEEGAGVGRRPSATLSTTTTTAEEGAGGRESKVSKAIELFESKGTRFSKLSTTSTTAEEGAGGKGPRLDQEASCRSDSPPKRILNRQSTVYRDRMMRASPSHMMRNIQGRLAKKPKSAGFTSACDPAMPSESASRSAGNSYSGRSPTMSVVDHYLAADPPAADPPAADSPAAAPSDEAETRGERAESGPPRKISANL